MITSVPVMPSWITGLNLNDNPLTDISAIYNAPWLTQMKFDGCGIRGALPSDFSLWPNLQYLNWGKNNFYGYLNETAFNSNPKIIEVDLSYNNLVGHPFAFLSPSPSFKHIKIAYATLFIAWLTFLASY
jgi:Leucine-rich repeat (LRR) protein